MRHWLLIAAAAVVAVVGLVGRGPLDASERGDDGRRFRVPETGRYHRAHEVRALLHDWTRADPERVRLDWIGGGPEDGIPALVLGGPVEDGEEITTVLLAGGPDGRSVIGTETALWATHGLLERLDRLPDHVRLLVIPGCAPRVLDRVAAGARPDGRLQRPVDEDGDGRVDEDGPDDLDGDGQVLELLVEDPSGPWCIASDGRTLVPAGPDDAPRYRWHPEGKDDDGDGQFNEDGPASVDLGQHFPVGWAGPGVEHGLRPLSAPRARALALWIAARRPSVALLFGGSHGGIHVHPRPDAAARDRVLADRLADEFARATGRRGVNASVGPARRGAMGDWLASVLGAVTVEIAAWGPGVVGLDGRPLGPVSDRGAREGDDASGWSAPGEHGARGRAAGEDDAAWARWLDEVRGGVGFVDWHPVDLGGGRTGLVGGWEPRTRSNPPEAEIAAALEGADRFVEELVAGLPRLEIDIIEAEREDRLVRITVQVINRGQLPTSVLGAGDLELGVRAACDISLLAGTPSVIIPGGLVAQGASRRVTWLLHVDPGATLEVEAVGPHGLRATRELRP